MRISFHCPLLVALLSVAAGGSARADSAARRPAPPAPTSEVTALKDSIAALANGSIHELSDSAGKTAARLQAVEGDLKRISVRLDGVDLAQWSRDQAATKAAVGDLVSKSDGLDQQMQELGSRLDGAALEAARKDKDLRAALGTGAAQLAALAQDERQWHELLPKDLAARAQAAAAAERASAERIWQAGALAAGTLAVLLIGGAWWQERRRRRGQRQILASLAQLELEFRQALAAAGAARASAATAGWNAIEDRLDQFARRWESMLALSEPPGGERFSAFQALDDAAPGLPHERLNGSSARHATLSPSEKSTVSVGMMPEPFIASRLLWPAEFLDPQSPLSRWRFLLESHFDDAEHPALPVLAGLLGLRAAASRPTATAPEIAAGAFRLSEALHAYWQSLPDLSAEDRQQASAAWIRHVRQLIAPVAPRVELREVMPGSRVDPDLMHATEERSGNHLNVAEVHSWAVVDRSGDRPKVFHRAQIAST